MKNHKIIKSITLPMETIVGIEKFQEEKEINSFSNSVRQLCEFGIKAHEYKPKVDSPDFIKSLQDFQKKENIFDWVKTLPPDAVQGFKMAIQMRIDEDDFAIMAVDKEASEWMVVIDRSFKTKKDAKNYITVLVLNVNRQ